MKVSSLLAAASWVFISPLGAADATSPVDYTQRNGPFAPGPTVSLPKTKPRQAEGIQDKRVTPPTVDKAMAGVGDRRAAIEVTESQPKNVRPNASRRPEAREHEVSAFNHRAAAITTQSDKQKPPMVAKYQDSLTAANAVKTERFPAFARGTAAKINRFVFRKNSTDAVSVPAGIPVVPAAGGSPVVK